MSTSLRPMSTGELLDQTFAMYRRNFWLFVGIVVPVPFFFLAYHLYESLALAPIVPGADYRALLYRRLFWEMTVMFLGWLFGLSLTHAATVRAVSALHLSRPISIRESYAALRGRVAQVIGIAFSQMALGVAGAVIALAVIFIVAVALVFALVIMGYKPEAFAYRLGFVVGMVGMFACAAGALAILARYALAVQACIIEGTGVKASMKRSAFLARKSFWRIALVYFLFMVLSVSITLGAQFAVKYVGTPFHTIRLTAILQAISGFCTGALLGPLATVAMSLIYYDERVRKEAFDLQLLIETLDGPMTSAATAD